MQFKTTLFFIASASLATAQSCLPDILLDDFSNVRQDNVDGAIRNVNLVGGDYGGQNSQFSFTSKSATPGFVSVTPGAPQADNFFFFKANARACFDLTGYTQLRIEMRVPAGADSSFTLTQKVCLISCGNKWLI